MFQNVLVALKDSADPGPLVELASTAAPAPARLHLVTLVRIGKAEDEIDRLRRAEERLLELASRLGLEGYDCTYETGAVGVAAAYDISRVAQERECDLMVIGLTRRSRVGKALMGSDAQRILLAATIPVLVTRLHDA